MAPLPPHQDPAALFTLCAVTRQAVADYYAFQGWPLPTYQAVDFAQPVADCAKFVVVAVRTGGHEGQHAQEVQTALGVGKAMRFAQLALTVLRCVPGPQEDGGEPSVVDTEAASLEILSDASRLMSALLSAEKDGTFPGCRGVLFEGWQLLNADGGIGGGTLTARFDLSGW